MPTRSPAARLLPALRRGSLSASGCGPTDGVLIVDIVRDRDPDVFAALVALAAAGWGVQASASADLPAPALGRLPTDADRAVILAQVAKQQNPTAAWQEKVETLSKTAEARGHAEGRRGGRRVEVTSGEPGA
jgi:hypothetical protein